MAQPFDAYWTSIDLKSVGTFAVAIGGLALPFLRGWFDGRVKVEEQKAKVAETLAERQERIYREQYDRVCVERDYHERMAREADVRRRAAEEDADRSRVIARAADDWAHWYRHGWVNVASRFRSLCILIEGMVDGSMARERASAIMQDIAKNPADDPPQVPLLQDYPNVKPPR